MKNRNRRKLISISSVSSSVEEWANWEKSKIKRDVMRGIIADSFFNGLIGIVIGKKIIWFKSKEEYLYFLYWKKKSSIAINIMKKKKANENMNLFFQGNG